MLQGNLSVLNLHQSFCMVEIEKTAYPRFSKYKKLSNKELQTIYTPSSEEILLAERYTKDPQNKFNFLVLLKSFQKLGYFLSVEEIPTAIKKHISLCLQLPENIESGYKHQKTFHSHKQVVRQLLGVNAFDQQARKLAINIGTECAYRINNLSDLINNIIEELLYKRYELPAFSTLSKLAKHCKATVNDGLFKKISNQIPEEIKKSLENLTVVKTDNKSAYNEIKLLPKRPTIKNLSHFIAHHNWLLSFGSMEQYLLTIAKSKIKGFINEAKVIDADGLRDLHYNKRLTLIVCLLYNAQISGVDNLIKMLCKIVNKAHKKAKQKLDQLRQENKWKIVDIVELLSDIIELVETNDPELLTHLNQKIHAKGNIQDLKNLCVQIIAFAKQDYLFLVSQFMSKIARNACYDVLLKLQLNSATSDKQIIKAIKFMLAKRNSKTLTLNIEGLDLSFIPAGWQKIILAKTNKQEVVKEHFEVCMLTEVANAFRAGDLITINSELFSGYKDHLLPKEECSSKINDYCNAINISATGKEGVRLLKEQLLTAAKNLDDNYHNIKGFRIDKTGTPILSRPNAKTSSKKTAWLKHQIKTKIKEKHILDVLCSTNHCIGWAKHFEHISGTATRIDHAIEKYILTVFATGTSMGVIQTVKHFKDLNGLGITPHMLYWISKRHISIPALDKAINDLINEIFQYQIINCWGDGKSSAADGTLRNIYEDNLLAEYHIRYGAKGGIAYHHVANNYIAFFVSFIPCGVWEAIAILEGLLKNESDLQPDTVHGDTQGQSAVVFGVAYLLGIKLMPRIRNWKEYTMFKADPKVIYNNIESLFTGAIDWDLIEECWEDFMQIVLSIKAGTISTKFLLQQLTNYARKNKLLKGLQELGYVIRTLFLIEYLSKIELRGEITATTNKVENFNGFSDWFNFGNKNYIVASNDPYEQEKAVKCNVLIANAMMLQNVIDFTNIILELQQEGYTITQGDVIGISPYMTEPFKRFGAMEMNYQDASRLISETQCKTIWESFLKSNTNSDNSEYRNKEKGEKKDEKAPS